MSMTYCGDCGVPINSDDDPGCFIDDDPYYEVAYKVLCETCRERYVREDMNVTRPGPIMTATEVLKLQAECGQHLGEWITPLLDRLLARLSKRGLITVENPDADC